jgi:hypothetical protein
MVKLYDISNWNEQSWWNTGGTRDKKIYLNPEDNELYYFKQSFKKGQRDYKHEFWSEIIASEIGIMLGFNVLEYNIAIRGNITGCISKSMINQTSEELIEGGKYLQAFDNTFNPENVKLRNQYNFELIVNALISFQKETHLKDLVETIVFDALIGNSDRHQENWAIINVHSVFSEVAKQFEQDVKTGVIENLPNWLKIVVKKAFFTDNGVIRPEFQEARLAFPKQTRFAPIYDSGCSFGRELETEKVFKMLDNEAETEKYVDKGQSEIHWESKKISHFDLLDKLLQRQEFKEIIIFLLEKIVAHFNIDKIENVVFNIDNHLVSIDNPNVLPKERKELIVKLLTLRFKRLKEIYSQNK